MWIDPTSGATVVVTLPVLLPPAEADASPMRVDGTLEFVSASGELLFFATWDELVALRTRHAPLDPAITRLVEWFFSFLGARDSATVLEAALPLEPRSGLDRAREFRLIGPGAIGLDPHHVHGALGESLDSAPSRAPAPAALSAFGPPPSDALGHFGPPPVAPINTAAPSSRRPFGGFRSLAAAALGDLNALSPARATPRARSAPRAAPGPRNESSARSLSTPRRTRAANEP